MTEAEMLAEMTDIVKQMMQRWNLRGLALIVESKDRAIRPGALVQGLEEAERLDVNALVEKIDARR